MVLYKNVDICDLAAIMKYGILSMDESGNNNWEEGKRAENSTSVVYLFSPVEKQNSFPNFGVALLEVDCDAVENRIADNDPHKDKYREYVAERVQPSKIKRVIIPEVFKEYVDVPKDMDITWCKLSADYYAEGFSLVAADDQVLEQFARTAALMDSTEFNFFRGIDKKGAIKELYNIQYVF